jgi:steroid 5-alpha reductase family enzyme
VIEETFEILTQYISWAEVIWVSVVIAGVLRYGFGRYRRVYYARRRYIKNDPKRKGDSTYLWLNTRAFNFLTIALIFWAWFILGIRAMLTPNPEGTTDIHQITTLVLIVGGAALLFIKGEYVERLENKAYDKYKDELSDVKGYILRKDTIDGG